MILSILLFIVPFIIYNVVTQGFGASEEDAGRFIGVGFTVITCLLWVSTYIFRVATKDMTYVSRFYAQLKINVFAKVFVDFIQVF